MTDREQAEFEARHNFFIGYGQRMDFRPVRPGKAAVPRRKVRRVAA